MRQLDKYIILLQEILYETERERANSNSMWSTAFMDNVIIPEISELREYANKGDVYFKYGKTLSQRMLQSAYFITDAIEPLDKTLLGQKILKLQQLYRNL